MDRPHPRTFRLRMARNGHIGLMLISSSMQVSRARILLCAHLKLRAKALQSPGYLPVVRSPETQLSSETGYLVAISPTANVSPSSVHRPDRLTSLLQPVSIHRMD